MAKSAKVDDPMSIFSGYRAQFVVDLKLQASRTFRLLC